MSAYQSNVDSLVAEYLKKQKQAEELRKMVDNQPQPFSRVVLIQYFIDEFNATHQTPLTSEERKRYTAEIAEKVRAVLKMTQKEAESYFKAIDEEKRSRIVNRNAQVIFDYCLMREVSKLKLSGAERDKLRSERRAAYQAGEFDYSDDERRGEEILIRMEDLHFPEGSKKLEDPEFKPTYELLLEKQKTAPQKVK